MKLPRDVGARRLTKFGYTCTRQKGSHMRFTTESGGQHHITIPNGTLHGILKDIAAHHRLSIDELVQRLEL